MPAHIVDAVSPTELRRHPEAANWKRPHTPEERAALKEMIATHGITEPIEVCGFDCVSSAGTVLDGMACVEIAIELGLSSVPVEFLDQLTESDERHVILTSTLSPKQSRMLTNRQLAWATKDFLDFHRDETFQGRATDDISVALPSWADLALLRDEKESRVKGRMIVFFHVRSTRSLQHAVDAGLIPLSSAAQKIMETASDIKRGVVSESEATAELEAWTARRIAMPPKRGRPSTKTASEM